jgi:glucose-1-phosphate thymidylyltransferase
MQAVILCAGRGKRLIPYTKNKPKPLLNVNGKALVERLLDTLSSFPIKEIIIVIGFQGNKIIEKLGHNYKQIKITYVKNKKYTSALGYSIEKALPHINSRFFIILGDILVKKTLIKKMLKTKADIVLPIFRDHRHEHGHYAVVVKNNKIIDFFNECTTKDEHTYDSPGIFLCSQACTSHIKKALKKGRSHRLDFLDEVLKERKKIKLVNITAKHLLEIDDCKDLKRVKKWL